MRRSQKSISCWYLGSGPLKRLPQNLRENLLRAIGGHVVAGNYDAAIQTSHRIQGAGVNGDYVVTDGGFTELVVGRQADEFLGW